MPGSDRENRFHQMRESALSIFRHALAEASIAKGFARHVDCDRGVLRVLNSRSLRGGFKLLGVGVFWQRLLERLRVGRDFTIEASRR